MRRTVLLMAMFISLVFALPEQILAANTVVKETFADGDYLDNFELYDSAQPFLYGGQAGYLVPGEYTMSIVNEGWDGGAALKIQTHISKQNYTTGLIKHFPAPVRHGKITVYGRRGESSWSGSNAYLVPIFLLGEPTPARDPQYLYRMVQYQFYQNGITYFDTAQYMHDVVPQGGVVKYRWYKFVVEWFEDNTFDLYLDDVKVASRAPMGIYNVGTPANGINAYLLTDAGSGVNDMYIDDIEIVSYDNAPPTAEAGTSQVVPVGQEVMLDGSGSTDPDGDAITFQWLITQVPSGCAVPALTNPTEPHPRFTPVCNGDYTIQLIVTDSNNNTSVPDTVVVSTRNTPPIANAGPDQSITQLGSLVTLDGSGSYDEEDGSPATYSWSWVSKPAGSNAAFSNPAVVNPTFVPDIYGEYEVQLVVTDSSGAVSSPDRIMVSTQNLAPVAVAKYSRSVMIGELVTLDGAESSDPNGDLIIYAWSFSVAPAGNTASIVAADTAYPRFIPNVEGTYIVQLAVSDGLLSAADTVEIVSFTETNYIIDMINDLQQNLSLIPASGFDNPPKHTIENFLTLAVKFLDKSNPNNPQAIKKVEDACDKIAQSVIDPIKREEAYQMCIDVAAEMKAILP